MADAKNASNLSNSVDLNTSSRLFRIFSRKAYLWMVGLYICLVFNEFIKKPVDFLALALTFIGMPFICCQNFHLLKQAAQRSQSTKLVFVSLLILSLLFLAGSLTQLPQIEGLVALGAQYGAHIGLAVVALLVIPLNEQSIRFFSKACLLALFLLALCDIAFYIQQVLAHHALGADYSHRWFGDGYVFLTPFLLTRLLDLHRQAQYQNLSQHRTEICILFALYLFLFLVLVLAGETGARSTYGILTLELLIFLGLLLWQGVLAPYKTDQAKFGKDQTIRSAFQTIRLNWLRLLGYFLLWLLMLGATRLIVLSLMPQLFESTLNRGLQIWDRVKYAWGPGLELIANAPALGHGFGRQAWDQAYSQLVLIHPDLINFGSPHNWFLTAGFFGGVLAVVMQMVLTFTLCQSLFNLLSRSPPSKSTISIPQASQACAMAVLVSFIAFYVLRGQVEFTIYKYLAITVIGFGLVKGAQSGLKDPVES
jgi:hypothetical protein